ncbi:MAG: RIP metalloprotease RseP [Geobacteraceae bacterium]|nr:RIP metalloprotease RseP [Geobacteraceae bacterium]
MLTIVSTIVVLGILIFVHELGHFLVAKLLGVGVETFSLGFGPRVVGKKIGETDYRLSAFPLGGYVKMVGEGGDDEVSPEELERSFSGKKPYKRIAIVAAGPVSNILFAFIILVLTLMIGFPVPTSRIGSVIDGKPAAKAGLKKDDVIKTINGKPVDRFDQIAVMITGSGGKPIDITVSRAGKTMPFRVVPEVRKVKNPLGETVATSQIGVGSSREFVTERYGPVDAVVKGFGQTVDASGVIVVVIGKLITGAIPLDNVGSLIMIGKETGQQAKAGLVPLLAIMAFLSINLGILNLLPIPILDGGHIVFCLWEMVSGRPVGLKTREIAQQVGLVMLLGLMALAFYNDIIRYVVKQG